MMIEQARVACKEGEELWFSILNPKDEMVGYAVANCFDERMGNVQMYIVIFEEYRRKHYARNAAKILMDYLFYHGKYVDTVVMGLTEEYREKCEIRKAKK